MEGLWGMVLGTILSRQIFIFLFHILNSKIYSIFDPIQRDLAKLSCVNRGILYFVGHILAISITVLLGIRLGFIHIVAGLILGFLTALIDICFEESIIVSVHKNNE